MTRVKLGAIVSSLTGKMGGSFFQNAKYGVQLSTINAPTTRNVPAQGAQRNLLGQVTGSWRGLTADEQKEWGIAAGGQGLGYSLFVKRNMIYYAANGSILTLPVTPEPLVSLSFNEKAIVYSPTPMKYIIRLKVAGLDSYDISRLVVRNYQNIESRPSIKPPRSEAVLPGTQNVSFDGTDLYIRNLETRLSNQPPGKEGNPWAFWLQVYDANTGAPLTAVYTDVLTIPAP